MDNLLKITILYYSLFLLCLLSAMPRFVTQLFEPFINQLLIDEKHFNSLSNF